MRFQKTVEIWGIEDKLRSGEVVLQCGQWVTCGGGVKSRYVGTNGLSLNIAHGGNAKEVTERFNARIAAKRACLKRFGHL